MKTKEQIKAWLESRPWYEKFTANTERLNPEKGYIDYVLRCGPTDQIISMAFIWHKTPEGHGYWQNISKEFTEWFNDKNK